MVEKLTYFVLLPCLITDAIATGDLASIEPGPILTALATALAAAVALLFAAQRVLRIRGPVFGPVFHGCIRPNGYLGIGACLALVGDAALPQISIVVALWVPAGLVLSVYVFLRSGEGDSPGFRTIMLRLARNPLLLSVVAGFALNASGAGVMLKRVPLLDIFGRAAVPMGLLAVGAALDLQAARAAGMTVIAATAAKLIGFPLLMAAICVVFGLHGSVAAAVLVIFAGMPTSPSGYVMASQLGGDRELMSSIITMQTAVSIITTTAIIWWLGAAS